MKTNINQIFFRYEKKDSLNRVSRETTKKIASYLGIDETQTIHKALYELAQRTLPKYEQDEGKLTDLQMDKIKKLSITDKKLKIKSSLLDLSEE